MPLYLKIIIGYLIVSYVINLTFWIKSLIDYKWKNFDWGELIFILLAPITVYLIIFVIRMEAKEAWKKKHPKPKVPRTTYSVAFKNLPFEPDEKQIIFIDSGHDDKLRQHALTHYDDLCFQFHRIGFEFIYIEAESSRKYMQPRCLGNKRPIESGEEKPIKSEILRQYMVNPNNWHCLSNFLLHYSHMDNGNQIFDCYKLTLQFDEPIVTFCNAIYATKMQLGHYAESDLLYCGGEISQEEYENAKEEFRKSIERLQVQGVTQLLLHKWLEEFTPVSRMSITEDYRIFLPDYDNQEIVMNNLPKALYFLFLRYPEGLYIKTLQDHYTELYNIYAQLNPTGKEDKMRLSITEITNPLSNRAHENISRANKAFKDALSEYTAQPYLIDGTKGELYSIKLDREKIDWKEE